MATILDDYRKKRQALDEAAQAERMPESKDLFAYAELAYRISVLESFQYLSRTAPAAKNMAQIVPHYQSTDAMISHIIRERRFADVKDEAVQKSRTTAYEMLCSIQKDYRKKFSGYAPASEQQYGQDVTKVINTVLPAWIQYRDTLLSLSK